MQNFLTARWRRYAVAFVVVAASLGVIGACNPTKPTPPPPPSCPGADAQTQTCLTIQPSTQNFTTGSSQTRTFTITNTGPASAGLGVTATAGAIVGQVGSNSCQFTTLGAGQSCTATVTSFSVIQGPDDWLVQICDNCQFTQLPSPFQSFRGVAAHLVRA